VLFAITFIFTIVISILIIELIEKPIEAFRRSIRSVTPA